MKQLAVAAIGLLSVGAVAQELTVPNIMFYVPSKNDSKINFTTKKAGCGDGKLFVFVTNSGGRITSSGCYFTSSSEIYVEYTDDGSTYMYPIDAMVITPEAEAFMEARRKLGLQ